MQTDLLCGDCRPILSALADGELSPEDEALVHRHLDSCADCSRALESITRVSQLLEDVLVRYPAPDVLKARIHSALALEAAKMPAPSATAGLHWNRSWLIAAGVAIAAASSGLTATYLQTHQVTRALESAVLTSHVRSLMPGHLVDVASTDQHNVKPWFNGRAALSPPVPRLDSADFRLIGGRLDYVDGRPAAVVVYGRRQHVLNVYVWPHPGTGTGVSRLTSQGFNLVTWSDNDMEFWVVSDLNAAELADFVQAYRKSEAPR